MTPADRAQAYQRQKPGAMTPKQQRRARKKALRDHLSSVAGLPATDSAPPVCEGHRAAHTPTAAACIPVAVGASLDEVAR